MAALSTSGHALAHDVANPLAIIEANADVERAAADVREKLAVADTAGVPGSALETARFVVYLDLAWSRHDISVCFWNGTAELQDFVMELAKVWTDAADLTFSHKTNGKNSICKDASSADIRINLDPKAPLSLFVNQEGSSKGDWSYLGRVSLNPKFLVTMNLPDVDRGRTVNPTWTTHAVRHEFGHALGLMHEHQRALCDEWFDYENISKLSGWTVEYAKGQIGKFPDSEIQDLAAVGDYDQQSIMQYNFAKEEFKQIPGKKNPCYREVPIDNLSAQDIEGIQVLYGPAAGSAATRTAGAMIPADASPADVAAARAELAKVGAALPTEAMPATNRDSTGGDAKSPKAAFDDLMTSVNAFADMVPPR